MTNYKRTQLYDIHKELGAKFIPFAGWEMPISYTGIKDEHMAVREAAGLFDVSHMGDIWVEGKDATSFLSYVLSNNPGPAKQGECIYAHILDENGRIIDDMIATKFSEERYLCVPNAATKDRVLEWFNEHRGERDVSLSDLTDEYVCIAFQGPKANDMLQEICETSLKDIKFFRFQVFSLNNGRLEPGPPIGEKRLGSGDVLVSRTGYTGEDGFELICQGEEGREVWKILMELGTPRGLRPIGLGARDTLRLEKGFLLSGTDFCGDRTPLETRWDFVVTWDHDFMGKESLMKQKETQHDKLRGLVLQDRGIPRHGTGVYIEDKREGEVTSGSYSPVLQKGIALAYLPAWVKKGTSVEMDIRGKRHPAKVVNPPFVE